ncbi:hypothetical protein ZOSMA_400G00030 [Zostera marina]|uniref:Uncharacterized protein n=1 Tax=Zostera marina TaxID=29655 RepID=A0A0K9P399_ZOSMR|nr:hypothetical protein ZOSMA_400G00030 [Zostera marina]
MEILSRFTLLFRPFGHWVLTRQVYHIFLSR